MSINLSSHTNSNGLSTSGDVQLIASSLRRLTEYDLALITSNTRYKWVTEGEYIWTTHDIQIKIPKGFLCDGSSGGPDFGHGWLFHDYLYSTHKIGDKPCTRHEADDIMIDILKWERAGYYALIVAFLTKWNPFWLFTSAWKTSGKRGPEFIHGDDMKIIHDESS